MESTEDERRRKMEQARHGIRNVKSGVSRTPFGQLSIGGSIRRTFRTDYEVNYR